MILSQIFLFCVITFILALFGLHLSSRISRISSETRFFKKLFLYSFLLRILLMFSLYIILIKVLPENDTFISGANNDESLYDRTGNEIARAWREGYNPKSLRISAPGFVYLNAIIYFLFGHNVLIVRAFSSFIGALIPIFVYMIAKYAYDKDKIAKTASILIAFMPTTLLYSIGHYKEVYAIFPLTFIVWALMKLKRKFSFFLLIAVISTWIYLMSVRFYFGHILLISAITYIIIGYIPRNQIKVTIVCLIVWLIIAKLGYKSSIGFIYNPTDYITFQYENVVGSTNVLYSIFSSGNKIATIPLVSLYSFLMPYPLWPFLNPYYGSSFDSWLFGIGSVAWYALMPFSVYGFFLTLKNRNSEKFLIFIVSLLTISLLSFSGQGVITAGRTKDSIMPFFMIFAGLGVVDYKRGKSNIRLVLWIYAALLYGSSLLYIYMRFPSIGTLFIKANFVFAALVALSLLLNLLKGRIWR